VEGRDARGGYRRAWFYDTQLLNAELFVSMAAATIQTSTICLATGVVRA